MQFSDVTLLDSHRIFQFRSLGLVSFQGFLQGSQVILGLFGIKGNRILGDFPDLPQVNQLVIGPVLERLNQLLCASISDSCFWANFSRDSEERLCSNQRLGRFTSAIVTVLLKIPAKE